MAVNGPSPPPGLSDCYYYGEGAPQDYAKAVEWYTQAAELCNSDAMDRLGSCYYCGDGVKRNYAKAVEWYKQAV